MTIIFDGRLNRHSGRNVFLDRSFLDSDRELSLPQVTLINGGQDTEILLHDGSIIVLKGMTHIEASAEFFR